MSSTTCNHALCRVLRMNDGVDGCQLEPEQSHAYAEANVEDPAERQRAMQAAEVHLFSVDMQMFRAELERIEMLNSARNLARILRSHPSLKSEFVAAMLGDPQDRVELQKLLTELGIAEKPPKKATRRPSSKRTRP